MMRIFYLLCLFLLISCQQQKKEPEDQTQTAATKTNSTAITLPEQVAIANKIEQWQNVKKVGFTFNVDRKESHFERRWIWETKTNTVTAITGNDTLSYLRKEMDSIAHKTNAGFINDKFWLLAPFNLVWDKGNYTYTTTEKATSPISKVPMQKLTIVYGKEGGYTPGDAYDFYLDSDLQIQEWSFRKTNQDEPSLSTTWEEYKNIGNLNLATSHKNEDGSFHLYFTDIFVE